MKIHPSNKRKAKHKVGNVVKHKLGEDVVIIEVGMDTQIFWEKEVIQRKNIFGKMKSIKIEKPIVYVYSTGKYTVRTKSWRCEYVSEEELE